MLGLLNPFNQDIEPARRRAAWIAAGVVALLALLAGINYYISQHRQIHIVNGFRRDLQVSIDGAPPIVVRPGQTPTPIREGKHKAKVTGGIEEELDFEVRAGYFARFFRKPAWVLVPGEGVILQKSNLIYAQNPEPGTNEFFFAKGLLYIPHCDYPFVDPPQTIDIGKNPNVKKTALALGTFSAEDVAAFVFAKDPDAAMRYLEQHLANNPGYEALGHTYIYFGNRLKEQNRVARFLREGLDKRPIVIAWHRNWSWLLESMGQTGEAFAYYDAAIKAEGESAPLLYLRSRVDPDAARSVESLATAMKLERSFPWLWYAEGNAALSSGDFPLAKKHFENAAELGVPLSILEDQVFLARLGAGEGPQLVTELQQKVQLEALNTHHIEQLTAALIANGSPDEARQAFEKWAQHPSVRNVMSNAYLDRMREQLMFRLGDLPGFEKALAQSRPAANDYDPYRREYLMVVGRANDVEVLPADDFSLSRKEMFGLEMALACHIAGDLERSKGWAEDVAKAWETQSGFERKGAEYLRAEKAPPYEEFAATRLSYFDKGLLAALIARRFPDESEPFAQLARKLTMARSVGSLVVAKALDSQ